MRKKDYRGTSGNARGYFSINFACCCGSHELPKKQHVSSGINTSNLVQGLHWASKTGKEEKRMFGYM
jgi:hypothetical protein